MHRIIVFTLLVLLLVACQNNDTPPAETIPETTTSQDSSETVAVPPQAEPATATPDPTQIPPTFTPESMTHGGHIYVVGGYTGETIAHTVQRGDTLAKLCAIYGVPIKDIARLNRIRNWNHIKVGETLQIPVLKEASES